MIGCKTTAIAVLQLKQRRTYWAGHPAIENLAARITTVARALQQRERRIPQTLRDMGYADGCVPDTENVKALLDVRRDTKTVQAPLWRPFALSKEKVIGGVGLSNLLQFAKDAAQQTNRVLPLLFDESIHYRMLNLLYGANQQANRCAYLRYVPLVYSVWHAYKYVVTHTRSVAKEDILQVPRPRHAEKLPGGVIISGKNIPHKGTSERIKALSLGNIGNKVIVVPDWEFFREQFQEDATQPFRLLGVGEGELKGGKYVVRSDIIVPVQRGSQAVIAHCADWLVFFSSVGLRAINGFPFSARYRLVVLPDPGCFALVEDLSQGGPWDEFEYNCPSSEARTPLHLAGNRELERDVKGMVNGDGQLCRPMQGQRLALMKRT